MMSTPLWIEAMLGQERAGRNAANSSNFLRIGVARLLKSRNRRIELAEFVADFAKRKPRRSEAGRKIGGLLQQIGRGREITLELKIAGEFVPAVGNQIAGGQEQSRGHLGTDFSLLETGLE